MQSGKKKKKNVKKILKCIWGSMKLFLCVPLRSGNIQEYHLEQKQF